MWNMFKEKNKDTRMTPLASFLFLYSSLWWCRSGVFIVNFEQVNAGWGYFWSLRLAFRQFLPLFLRNSSHNFFKNSSHHFIKDSSHNLFLDSYHHFKNNSHHFIKDSSHDLFLSVPTTFSRQFPWLSLRQFS